VTTGAERLERLGAARIYLIVTADNRVDAPLGATRAALASGAVDIVQLRRRTPGAMDAGLVQAVQSLAAASGVLFIVNDDVALAARVDADGAHVGQGDMPVEAARALLGRDRILGLSTHDEYEIAAARRGSADYVGLGPCFGSRSKQLQLPPGGAPLVRRGQAAAGPLPLFPIGGIDAAHAPLLVAAGAARLAVGAGILDAADPGGAALRLRRLLA
jgi:thiamine-phosphate pyrophosphorylase